MSFSDAEQVLRALLMAKSSADVRAVLQEIGDSADVGLDAPFAPFSFAWHAFGDNPSNVSSIGLASKAGRSLSERVTNALDAILEGRLRPAVPPPLSPQEAAQQWFGRPITGPEEGLYKWRFGQQHVDRRASVILHHTTVKSAPTVDVIDDGVGIAPEDFPGTILSLQAGNKIRKRYLIGAFGQGGASTLAFCDYAIIISRSMANPRVVAFTVVRVLKLDSSWKEDCYGYLCLRDSSGHIAVPSCQMDEPLVVVDEESGIRAITLSHGTLVRHIGFKLSGLDGTLQSTPNNLYHFLHASLFDPVLPFRIIDLRGPGAAKDELVTGARNRLMKLVEKGGEPDQQDTGSQVRHHRPMEYVVPHGSLDPVIGVEYWVILNYRKGRGPGAPPILRAESNELFIQKGFPIVGTLNGQNQGELRAKLVRDLGLGMVARHIVVNIDATLADSRVRRELFATNREGFKDGPVLDGLVQVLTAMLEEDEELHEIERELTEKLAKRETQTTRDEVKRQVTRLLQEAGLQLKEAGPSAELGEGQTQASEARKRGRHRRRDPLPTLPFPDVTRFEIVTPKPVMKVAIGSVGTLLVETDADSEFDRRQLIMMRSEPDCLELAAKVPLRGGRVRWRLRPRATAKAGDVGSVIVSLTRPDGRQLVDKTDFTVLPRIEAPARPSRGVIPPFDIIPINPVDDAEQWETVWPNLNEQASEEDQGVVAYKPVAAGGGVTVYYSTIFTPFKAQVERMKLQSAATLEAFTTTYEIWIGYHAILQENARKHIGEDLDAEILEQLYEDDRVRVGTIQVKQSLQAAELMRQRIQSTDAD